MKNLTLVLRFILLGFGGEQKDCIVELIDNCPVTLNIDYVCGSDGVSFVNRSEAECHPFYS